MLQKVMKFIKQHQMLAQGEHVLAGVSGGADSVCLLLMFEKLREMGICSFTVVHVQHHLRGAEAERDAKFVEQLCREKNIPFLRYDYEVAAEAGAQHKTLEEMGRELRYEAFTDAMQKTGAARIALAHHMEDQAETMLFHLFRGSGLKGLSGMEPVRDAVIRPLLCLTRSETEAYVREQGMDWCEDITNGDDFHMRNKIRHHVVSYAKEQICSNAVVHMARTADQLREADRYMRQQALLALQEGRERGEEASEGHFSRTERTDCYPAACFLAQPPVIQTYMIRECLRRLPGGLKDLTAAHVEAVQALLQKQTGKRVGLPGGRYACLSYGEIQFGVKTRQDAEKETPDSVCCAAEPSCSAFVREVQVPGMICLPGGMGTLRFEERILKKNEKFPISPYTKWFDYDKIRSPLVVRTRRAHDVLAVLPDGGHKKIKEYFIDEKIPQGERDRRFLLAEGSEILWVLDGRISEAYKVTAQTGRVLAVNYTKE